MGKQSVFQGRAQVQSNKLPAVFAAKSPSKVIRELSSSGGAFYSFAANVINSGGVVYGCVFSKDLTARHIRCDNIQDVMSCMGSKYSQSDMGRTISNITKDLEAGIKVLFSGTPCQAAAVKKVCGEIGPGELILVDVICHGVPSPGVFHQWVQELGQRRKSKVVHYEHRNKDMGWGHYEKIYYEDGRTEQMSRLSDSWRRYFGSDVGLRPSCYQCPYAKMPRSSDVTIGDFWGIEHTDLAEMANDNLGVSVVIANSELGLSLINDSEIEFAVASLEDAVSGNPMLGKPPRCPDNRGRVWEELYSCGVIKTMKAERYTPSFGSWVLSKVKKLIKSHLMR